MKISRNTLKEKIKESLIEEREFNKFEARVFEIYNWKNRTMTESFELEFRKKIKEAWDGRKTIKESITPLKSDKFYLDTRKNKTLRIFSVDGDTVKVQYFDTKSKKPTGKTDTYTKGEVEYWIKQGAWGEYKQPFLKSESIKESINPDYFPPFSTDDKNYLLIGKRDHNFIVAVSRYSDVGSFYKVYTKKGNKYVGTANSIKGGEAGAKKIPLTKSIYTGVKSMAELLKKVGIDESVNESESQTVSIETKNPSTFVVNAKTKFGTTRATFSSKKEAETAKNKLETAIKAGNIKSTTDVSRTLNEDEKKVWIKNDRMYVDSDFVNFCKGKLPNSELKHAGMGDFFLQTSDGNISFSRVGGKFDGMSGRGHQMDGDKKLVAQLIKKMGAKIINESFHEPDGTPIGVDKYHRPIPTNEGPSDTSSDKLNIGDKIRIQGFVMLKGLDSGTKWKVIKTDDISYTFQKVGSSKKVRFTKSQIELWIKPSSSDNNQIIKEQNLGHAEVRRIEKNISTEDKKKLHTAIQNGKIKTSNELKDWIRQNDNE